MHVLKAAEMKKLQKARSSISQLLMLRSLLSSHLSLELLPCPCTSTADMIQNKFTQKVDPANNQLSKEAESQIYSPSGSLCVHAT